MTLNEIIARELKELNQGAVVESVPDGRRATPESLRRLEREIQVKTRANAAMSLRSAVNAQYNVCCR